VLGAFVLLELFLAIILGAFENILQQERDSRERVSEAINRNAHENGPMNGWVLILEYTATLTSQLQNSNTPQHHQTLLKINQEIQRDEHHPSFRHPKKGLGEGWEEQRDCEKHVF
jgi:hypothetical protein